MLITYFHFVNVNNELKWRITWGGKKIARKTERAMEWRQAKLAS
jgi:hypothetical protein